MFLCTTGQEEGQQRRQKGQDTRRKRKEDRLMFFVKRLRLGHSRWWKIQQMTQPKIGKRNVNRKIHGPAKSRNTAKA